MIVQGGTAMQPSYSLAPVLLAEDDPDDRFLLSNAVRRAQVGLCLRFVRDGEELMDYLFRKGAYAHPAVSPRPSLILLDLNMQRKDGREALREIKAAPELRSIPVLVLTTSHAQTDIDLSYGLGVNAYLTKPNTVEDLQHAVRILYDFWFRTARLPY